MKKNYIITLKIIILVVYTSFSLSCSKSIQPIKKELNANGNYCPFIVKDQLFVLNGRNIQRINLITGDIDVLAECSKKIDEKKIVGLFGPLDAWVQKDNKIFYVEDIDEEVEYDKYPFIIPENYSSIILQYKTSLTVHDKNSFSMYGPRDKKWKLIKEFSLEKDYESAFYCALHQNGTIGFISGNEIDLISLTNCFSIEYKPNVLYHLVLDKQFDAYVGYYDEQLEKQYLLCIDNDIIQFYDIELNCFDGKEIALSF